MHVATWVAAVSAPNLQAVLGSPPAPRIADLDAEDQQRLASLVGRARDEQSRALDAAIEGGLKHIPRPLRGVVRRALFR